MKPRILIIAFACLALLGAVSIPSAEASQFDKKTIFTIDQAMGIPGTVLEPGTYVIKLVGPHRTVVQVLDQDETHVYATVLAISEERLDPAEKAELTFEAPSPFALKTWFYPGETIGWRFVYPKESEL